MTLEEQIKRIENYQAHCNYDKSVISDALAIIKKQSEVIENMRNDFAKLLLANIDINDIIEAALKSSEAND